MADSSDSEEFVSADEGLEDFQTTAARGTGSPPSGASSPPPDNLHVASDTEPPNNSSQTEAIVRDLVKERDSPDIKGEDKKEVIVHDHLDSVEPHPPAKVEDRDEKDRESEDPLFPKPDLTRENGVPEEIITSENDAASSIKLKADVVSVSKLESSGMELNTGSDDVVGNVDTIAEVSTTAETTVCTTVESTLVERKEEHSQNQEVADKREGEERDEEKAPVPPPRRKRKKKMNKQPSLENLVDSGPSDLAASVMHRSMTVSSTDFRREGKKKKERQPSNKMASQQQAPLDVSLKDSKMSSPEVQTLEGGGKEDPGSPTGSEDVEVKSKPSKLDGMLDGSLRSSRSATPTPAISIEPDGSLELTEDMINGMDNEVIKSDTLQSAKARGSNNTGLGVIIPSDDESVDGEALLLLGEEEEGEEPEGQTEEQVDVGGVVAVGGVGVKGEGGGAGGGGGEKGAEGMAEDALPGSTPKRGRGVSQTSEEERGHDHERTPQPSDHQERTLEPVKVPQEQKNTDQNGPPTDNAILESTMIKNLDTGEVMPLSAAEERIPRGHGWSPLSEHLLRRTNPDGHLPALDEDEMEDSQQRGKIKKRLMRFTKWGKRKGRHGDGQMPLDDDTMSIPTDDHQHTVKYKNSSNKQGQLEFERVRLKQDLTGQHLGAVWAMEFSICGRLLATAGQDSVVRVWVLRTAYVFFHELQSQYQRLGVHSSVDSLSEKASMASNSSKSSEEDDANAQLPFLEAPLCAYYGHTADILDLSWSKNFFLLSSSMDKTVRLWHISRKECLCCFQHVDFVTAIAFHPRDDRYFLSGSLDGKLRLWNIPDKKVALWNEIEGVGSHLITAANFCMNGKLAVVGTYDGRCIFYETEHLKYHTQIHVRSRHGKNRGRKISGVEPLPGEDKLLVTSNDSRIRLYNLKDHSLSCKYRGCLNTSSQIKATFSRDGQYIISGSEDNFVYVWKTHIDMSKMPSRRDRNEFYESFSTHSAPVTTAIFAPVPGITVDQGIKEVGEMIVAADYQGCIKIYVSNENL